MLDLGDVVELAAGDVIDVPMNTPRAELNPPGFDRFVDKWRSPSRFLFADPVEHAEDGFEAVVPELVDGFEKYRDLRLRHGASPRDPTIPPADPYIQQSVAERRVVAVKSAITQ